MEREPIRIETDMEVYLRYEKAVASISSDAWKEIREGDYFEKRDTLETDREKYIFTIQRIAKWKLKKLRKK